MATRQPDRAPLETADVVILGAGYGGLHVAQRLASLLGGRSDGIRPGWTIVLLDRRSHHQLTTELPRLVSGQLADSALDLSLDQLIDQHRVAFRQAEVTHLDLDAARVGTAAGPLAYRYLVVALGSISHDFGIPGVQQHMRPFLTTADARDLRLAVARAIDDGARLLQDGSADQATLTRYLTVVVGGAGATGVEVAGELAEFMADRWGAARRLAGEPAGYPLPRPRVRLIDASPQILTGWSPKNVQAATRALQELGVEVRVNAAIARAEPGRVVLKDGQAIEAQTLVWAGGVRAPKLLAESGLTTGAGGRVVVDDYQRVPDRPNVFVVGDAALLFDDATGRPLPPTADLALREGETAALAIQALAKGDEPERVLRPLSRVAVSVGRERGAASLLGLEIKGRAAHALKDLIEWEYRQSITKLHGHSAATVV